MTNRADSMTRDCYIVRTASTVRMMGCGAKSSGLPEQNELYTRAVAAFGRMLDRLAAGYRWPVCCPPLPSAKGLFPAAFGMRCPSFFCSQRGP